MKPTRRSLTRKLDLAWSELIRSRGKCQKCGKTETLQACHIFSRNQRTVRWNPLNGLCLCAGCHFHSHQNPILFTQFVEKLLGDIRFNLLLKRAREVRKWQLHEMESLLSELESPQEDSLSMGRLR